MDNGNITNIKNTRLISVVLTLSYKIVPGMAGGGISSNVPGGASARVKSTAQGVGGGTQNVIHGVVPHVFGGNSGPSINAMGEPVPGAEVYMELEPDDEP